MKKKILLIAAGAILFFLVIFIIFFEFSTSPMFCRSCHIMEPYYKSWEASKHKGVACVDCHYPPAGPRTLLWKKFQAMSQVVKYITRTYGSRPFAEVDDSACLREGCHSKRLIEGKLVFARGIKFDHRPHLLEPRRGRQLRCVSCHSQIVVGRHIEVTLDTCYLCHFKGFKESRSLEPIGGCASCHELPEKEFTIENIKYRHKDFVTKYGVECQSCHLDVIQGEGGAPKERCLACHNQPDRLEKYNDAPFIHENHITRHHVACFHCHTEMTHSVKTHSGMPRPETARPKTTQSAATSPEAPHPVETSPAGERLDCAMCHSDMHSGQKDMYEGRGGRGIPDMPSPMHLAQVDCVACHIVEERPGAGTGQGAHGKTFKASEEACIKCHGKKYAGLTGDWKKELDMAVEAIAPRIKDARDMLSQVPADAPNFARLKHLYDAAQYNYDFVRFSTGIHNIYYSAKLLEDMNKSLNSFYIELKKTPPELPKASLLDGSFCATLCHAKLSVRMPEEVKYKERAMPHSLHIEMVGPCGSCHVIGRHKDISLKADLSICKTCHEGGM